MPTSRFLLPLIVAFLGFASLACGAGEGGYCETMFDCGDGLDCVDSTCVPYNSPSGGSADCGATNDGSYDYTFSCEVSGPYTVPVPIDGCEAQSEYYAEVFGCNDMERMYDACLSYSSCYCLDSSACDGYAGL